MTKREINIIFTLSTTGAESGNMGIAEGGTMRDWFGLDDDTQIDSALYFYCDEMGKNYVVNQLVERKVNDTRAFQLDVDQWLLLWDIS